MLDLAIYTCAHREINAGTASAMEIFRLTSKINYLWLILTGDALIGRARSICCSKFLENYRAKKVSSAPYMLFLDDDILFRPDDINRIYRDMKDGHDLVAGAYPVKDGTELAAFGYGEDVPFDGRLIPCHYLATGFMGISARLLEKMVTELKMTHWNEKSELMNIPLLHKGLWCECYPFFENYGKADSPFGAMWLSEDYEFCEKARMIGVEPMLDTGIQLGHVGVKAYHFNDVVEHHKKRMEDAKSG